MDIADRTPLARARTLALVVSLIAPALAASAQDAPGAALPVEPPRRIHSLGQPPVWKPLVGAFYLRDDRDASGGGAYAGVYRDLTSSLYGVGVSGELYANGVAGRPGAELGVRAFADLRGLLLKLGVDRSFERDRTDFMLSLQLPLRRGGILGHGTHVRLDWLPSREGTWQLGIQVPLEPNMGRTRPRQTEVRLPAPPPGAFSERSPLEPAVREALSRVEEAAQWVVRLNSVFWDDSRDDRVKSLERTRQEIRAFKALYNERTPLRPDGHTMARELALLHGELARAFGLAAGAEAALAVERGEPLAARARQALLEDVVYPFNRRFGQFKTPDTLLGLAARASDRFAEALAAEPAVERGRHARVRAVFESYSVLLERLRRELERKAEGDPRLTFIPFSLVLRPEQHDTQQEIDAIVGRAQETPFSRGNSVLYLSGQQFQRELNRMILETEDYHVLWLHDFAGVDRGGDVDVVGFYQSVESYLEALTRRVRDYDRSGRLPVYLLLVDLYYTELNKGRLFLDLLEDPLGHSISLPGQHRPETRRLQLRAEQAQLELRRAVAGSARLQEQQARLGRKWLRDVVKVHVSVMNPSDLSFRTSRLVRYLPIVPDNVIRDHRKIAFRDISEEDPARGEALVAGVAVGEFYTTETWEDRALIATGPATLAFKDAARRYLLQNGVREAELPAPLVPRAKPPDYDARVRELEARGWTATALAAHNDRGFARKDASIATLVLYSLLPPGSLIVVPDSIWTSMTWASQLVGAALRGCHVYVIAPSARNAPSEGFAELSRSHEVFTRFYEIQTLLGPEIEAAGGRLRTGLYTRTSRLGDMPARFREVAARYRRYGFLRDEFPVGDDFLEALDRAATAIEAEGFVPEALPPDYQLRPPKLHRKTQFFAGREALRAIARRPEVDAAIKTQIALETVVTTRAEARPLVEQDRFELVKPMLLAEAGLSPELAARSLFYLSVGSRNQDVRGAILDGEVLYFVSGSWSLSAYADMFLLFGSTTWIESPEEMERLLPPPSEWKRRIGRWLRKVI